VSIHPNSAAAWVAFDHSTREALVLSAYRLAGVPLSDRQVAGNLGFQDMNMVRPTITRLCQEGRLVERGSVVDSLTKRTVRLMAPADPVQLDLLAIL
jgi:uncharacterized alpha-E superfamily protein